VEVVQDGEEEVVDEAVGRKRTTSVMLIKTFFIRSSFLLFCFDHKKLGEINSLMYTGSTFILLHCTNVDEISILTSSWKWAILWPEFEWSTIPFMCGVGEARCR
jgi:hypothetical protein